MKAKQGKYTVGPVKEVMLKNTLAMLPGTLAISGYNIVDTFFIGRLPGNTALAAMGFTFPMVMLMGCLFNGIGAGVVTPMAHALGSMDHKRAEKLVTYGLIMAAIVSVMVMIFGILGSKWIFGVFGAKGETLEQTIRYMNVWFIGCITSALLGASNGLLIACGDSKASSMMMLCGLALNVGLDPIFIFSLKMGMEGAALATVISQLVGAVVILLLLANKHKLLVLKNLNFVEFKESYKVIIKYAIPSILAMLLLPLGNAIMTRIVSQFGDVAVASVAAVSRLEMVAFIIPMAMGVTVMPMIAQNYGAKLYDRIEECCKFAMHFAMFFLVLMGILFFIFAKKIAPMFSTDVDVQMYIAMGLQIIPLGLAGVEVNRFAGFLYSGTGHPHKAAWLNALRILGLLIPLSLLALLCNSFEGTFWARLATDIIAGIVGYVIARRVVKNLKHNEEKREQEII